MAHGTVSRRVFLGTGAASLLATASRVRAQSKPASEGSADDIRCGLIGVGGRGAGVLEAIHKSPGVRVTALCDIVEDLPVDNDALQRLVQLYPEDLRVLALVMAAHEQKRNYTEALRLARELLRRDPQNELWLSYARRLGMAEHWLLLPWRLFERFGAVKVMATWVVAMPMALFLERSHPRLCYTLLGLAGGYMAYCLFVVPVLVLFGARIRRV